MGRPAGTTGESRRIEAYRIYVENGNKSGVSYRAYCADEGWQRWVTSNNNAGTIGKKRQLEAIQVKLSNGLENKYDIYYRVHCANYGWLGWAKNGETAGGTGTNIRIEAFQLKIVIKNSSFLRGGDASYVSKIPSVLFQAYVMDKGWLSKVSLGETVGTVNEARRLEAFSINLMNNSSSGISYRAHCSDIGWQSWKSSGQVAGPVGQKRQVEGIQIKLANGLEKKLTFITERTVLTMIGWGRLKMVSWRVQLGKILKWKAFR